MLGGDDLNRTGRSESVMLDRYKPLAFSEL
jgi:hypothetical protein